MCVCGILCVNYLVCHDPWEQLRGFHLLSGWVPGYSPGRSLCITPELHLLSITGGLLKPALPATRPQFILPPTVVAGPHLHATLTAPSYRSLFSCLTLFPCVQISTLSRLGRIACGNSLSSTCSFIIPLWSAPARKTIILSLHLLVLLPAPTLLVSHSSPLALQISSLWILPQKPSPKLFSLDLHVSQQHLHNIHSGHLLPYLPVIAFPSVAAHLRFESWPQRTAFPRGCPHFHRLLFTLVCLRFDLLHSVNKVLSIVLSKLIESAFGSSSRENLGSWHCGPVLVFCMLCNLGALSLFFVFFQHSQLGFWTTAWEHVCGG